MLKEYFLKYHSEELLHILNAPEDHLCYSIYINFLSLFDVDVENANKILQRPRIFLPLCDIGAIEAQKELANNDQIVKKRVKTRITGVPPAIDERQIGGLISISGIVVRTSQPTVLKLLKRYKCKKCDHVTLIKLEWERQTFREVKECESCHVKNISAITILEPDDCSDYQEIKIQENYTMNNNSTYAVSLQVVLLDDLVDKCRPGDNVTINGMYIHKWGTLKADIRAVATIIMIANSVSVRRKLSETTFSNQEMKDIFSDYWNQYKSKSLVGRDRILMSICPQLYGMHTIKLALAVILAGGVPKMNDAGTRVRGEPHLLMIGDPGTGKSQILRAASRLAVRSVLTTGVGTTAAGLTAAAVKDTDGWHLEAGALVLADGGICCVDEFTTMSAQDRAAVHEAMEQQTVSIAKAGMVSSLNTRCSVIAAINPVGGRFTDDDEWKTRLGNPLLSRFDLILLLKDNKNAEWDKMTSDHILHAARTNHDNKMLNESTKPMDFLKSEGIWKEESLREYFAHIHTLKPVLTKFAKKILSATYLYHRSNPDRRAERTTVRLLDSLIRLAEGHARLMYRSEIGIMDALIAADLIGTISPIEKELNCSFPVDPMETYRARGRKLLQIIGLEEMEHLL
ncbi:DNA helicase MCM9-like [Prorops nasuta]|uniref:DNA helicase MCM9-like n=1 Tax=Prorops nasuta TaxID=863751 RepID=UPI0034CFE29D